MSDEPERIHYRPVNYGFEFGSAVVTRLISDFKKKWVVVCVGTPKHKRGIQVYVTKTGKVRISDERGEWTPPAKKGKK